MWSSAIGAGRGGPDARTSPATGNQAATCWPAAGSAGPCHADDDGDPTRWPSSEEAVIMSGTSTAPPPVLAGVALPRRPEPAVRTGPVGDGRVRPVPDGPRRR
ncbi:hypothetical protein TPA0908_41920 [Micromonospora sp. AKA38]|nr:hypothetical protein TPA0908_41920 [Micromonospora sp. AKA38]